MTLLPVIDELVCPGHGDCADIAPDVFRVDLVAEGIGTGPDDLIRAAARACPAARYIRRGLRDGRAGLDDGLHAHIVLTAGE
jgi:ferredoxin